jgi:inner membrane protein
MTLGGKSGRMSVMDTATHAALGAAIGEAVLGKKIGNWAMLWGAVAGSLPDVDLALARFEDDVGSLTHHRGITHSLLFVLILSTILGWLVSRWYRRHPAGTTPGDWGCLFSGCLLTHVLLDACTTYGTPLLLPFSPYRVALNNIFIIDPLFTIPLLSSGVVCLFLSPRGRRRRLVNRAGLALSLLYLSVTFVSRYHAQEVFAASLASQQIEAERFMTAPTPLNSILWYCIAEGRDGCHIGYYSLLDRARQIRFRYVPRNDELIRDIKEDPSVQRLVQFSKGYYAVRREESRLVFEVLKFGMLTLDTGERQVAYSFAILSDEHGAVTVKSIMRRRDLDLGRLMDALWNGIWGQE